MAKTVVNNLNEEELLSYFIRNRQENGIDDTVIQQQYLELKSKLYEDSSVYDDIFYKEKLEYLVRVNRQALEYSDAGVKAAVAKAVNGL